MIKEVINIQTGTTHKAEKEVYEALETAGTVTKVEHTRDKEHVEYHTTITCENKIIRVDGGLTSGYGGAGCNGLIRVLVKTGIVSEIEAKRAVYKSDPDVHQFTFPAEIDFSQNEKKYCSLQDIIRTFYYANSVEFGDDNYDIGRFLEILQGNEGEKKHFMNWLDDQNDTNNFIDWLKEENLDLYFKKH